MSDVLKHLRVEGPMDVDDILNEFGPDAIGELHDLLEDGKISFDLEWNIAPADTGTGPDGDADGD